MIALSASPQAKGYKQLYAFHGGSDGSHPQYNLLLNKGDLYGSALYGGALGFGTLFRLTPDGKETTLYSFRGIGSGDGAYPGGPPVVDKAGNLYDETFEGGTGSCFGGEGCGTVFKLAPDGTETVLHAFRGGSDGASPDESVILDDKGNLYGTTEVGGSGKCSYSGYPPGCGTIFKLAPDGTETVLYAFRGGSTDGSDPSGNLVADTSGNLYGTTTLAGGTACQGFGCGTVFKLAPDGTERVLYSFCARAGCSDGADPIFTSLFMDRKANLYGTTEFGGSGTGCGSGKGCGAVYKLAPDGTETVLYSFCSLSQCSDGDYPDSNVIVNRKGDFVSTTAGGGAHGFGALFGLSRHGAETLLYSFKSGRDGASPNASVIADPKGHLYGTTYAGGSGNCTGGCGTVYTLGE